MPVGKTVSPVGEIPVSGNPTSVEFLWSHGSTESLSVEPSSVAQAGPVTGGVLYNKSVGPSSVAQTPIIAAGGVLQNDTASSSVTKLNCDKSDCCWLY